MRITLEIIDYSGRPFVVPTDDRRHDVLRDIVDRIVVRPLLGTEITCRVLIRPENPQ